MMIFMGVMVMCLMITEVNLWTSERRTNWRSISHREVRSKGKSGTIGVKHVQMNVPNVLKRCLMPWLGQSAKSEAPLWAPLWGPGDLLTQSQPETIALWDGGNFFKIKSLVSYPHMGHQKCKYVIFNNGDGCMFLSLSNQANKMTWILILLK